MSDLFRQSVSTVRTTPAAPPKPRPRPTPNPHLVSELNEHSSSDSSASSADSAASVNTVRPSSREHEAPPTHWTSYFARELFLEKDDEKQKARYHVYLTPPTDSKKDPLFICHHGAGISGLSFAIFAQHVRRKLPNAGVLALEARAHGYSTVTDPATGGPVHDYSLATLTADALTMINLTKQTMQWSELPPTVLVGHSMGGAVVCQLAFDFTLGPALIGYSVIDVVEGSATEAFGFMKSYLNTRPSIFNSIDAAISWHLRSRTLRDRESAEASVPSLLVQTENGKWTWKTNLHAMIPYWDDWFGGMSQKFLKGRGAKQLILAGTDRLDKDLMIGQMQGKFQLVVIPEAGHFVQEDVPEQTAQLLVGFFKRNDRGALVLPPKVSDLIAQGKKV